MSPTSYQLLHPAIYFFNCFTISNSGFDSRRATPPQRTPPRNIHLVIAILLYSFSFGERNVQTFFASFGATCGYKDTPFFTIYNSFLYATVGPSPNSFSEARKLKAPSAFSAIKIMPCDSIPRIFLGAKFNRTKTVFPMISAGE